LETAPNGNEGLKMTRDYLIAAIDQNLTRRYKMVGRVNAAERKVWLTEYKQLQAQLKAASTPTQNLIDETLEASNEAH
jgi:hypothetical protein